jgi:hypothetical protein
MKKLKEMIDDSSTYLESVGKLDKHELAQIIKRASDGTVLRICLWRC